jgi:serine/threonine protein kinase
VTVFDFGQTSDRLLFLAMELLEGEMLSTRLKREGPLDVLFAIRVAMGVLRSLDEAHARGIVHRDLKPDNIFLAKVHGVSDADSEVVKVVDFGIAKIRDGERGIDALQTQEGTVFGTPRYMSPEQAQGKPLDGRSDLYAVGVLLFHMLTGRPPFTDDDAVIVMAHHIKTVPPPVRQVAPNRPIPASLERLVQRALSKDPAKRPQTAAEFLHLLEEVNADARALVDGRSTALTGANRASARMRFATYGIASIGAVALLVGLWPMRSPRHAANTTAQTRSLTPMQPRELATINATRFERVTHAAAAVPAQASQRSDSTSTSLTLTEPAPESARAEPTNTATKQSQSTSTSRAVRRSTVRGSSPSMQTVTFTRRTHAHVGIVQRWTD